jgi:hypothetical protein
MAEPEWPLLRLQRLLTLEKRLNRGITRFMNKKGFVSISFHNSNIQNGVPIAIILQYGHGTGTGGWVAGRDYINPAIRPIFDQIANDAWKEVTKT